MEVGIRSAQRQYLGGRGGAVVETNSSEAPGETSSMVHDTRERSLAVAKSLADSPGLLQRDRDEIMRVADGPKTGDDLTKAIEDDFAYIRSITEKDLNGFIKADDLYGLEIILHAIDRSNHLPAAEFFRLANLNVDWEAMLKMLRFAGVGGVEEQVRQRTLMVDVRKIFEKALEYDYTKEVSVTSSDSWLTKQKKNLLKKYYDGRRTYFRNILDALTYLEDEAEEMHKFSRWAGQENLRIGSDSRRPPSLPD